MVFFNYMNCMEHLCVISKYFCWLRLAGHLWKWQTKSDLGYFLGVCRSGYLSMMTAYHLLPLSAFVQIENLGSTPVAYQLHHMPSISSVTFGKGQYQKFFLIQIIYINVGPTIQQTQTIIPKWPITVSCRSVPGQIYAAGHKISCGSPVNLWLQTPSFFLSLM